MAIGIVAHDDKKKSLLDWVKSHESALAGLKIVATGTTGGLVQRTCSHLDITSMKSGPLGGDQQLGALIAEGELQALIFFIDPLSPHPHDVDVKALIRLATLYDIPFACNEATAELLLPFLNTIDRTQTSERS